MDATERSKLRGLSECVMRPGSTEKRFVRDMVSKPSEYELSPKQKRLLDVLYWRYRKQINAHITNGRGFVTPTEPQLVAIDETDEQGQAKTRFEIGDYAKEAARKKSLAKLEKWNRAISGGERTLNGDESSTAR